MGLRNDRIPRTAVAVARSNKDMDMELDPEPATDTISDGHGYKREMKVDETWLKKPFEEMEWREKIFSQVSYIVSYSTVVPSAILLCTGSVMPATNGVL
jgi:hypothetical protein